MVEGAADPEEDDPDLALWRVRLFERGPIDASKCLAGIWSNDKTQRAVICQCPSKRPDSGAFCKKHTTAKQRHGTWNQETAELEGLEQTLVERCETVENH